MNNQGSLFQPLSHLQVVYRGWGEEWVLGQLAESTARGRYLFEYTPEALEHKIEFSPYKLPLSPVTYSSFEHFQDYIPGFIADSLPDGWGLLLMDKFLRRHDIEPGHISVFDRLALLGINTMGALTYEPKHPLPDDGQTEENIRTLIQLAQQIHREVDGKDSDALRELIQLGGSPQGARPKALVEYAPGSGRMATMPFEGSYSWLMKFPAAGEKPSVCALEYVYAEIAHRAGIVIPEVHYFNLGSGLAAFGIQRFDRFNRMRIPVLSMAGALHADFRQPCMDYTDILRATAYMTRSVAEREVQARRMVFNVLMHNRDDHVKNFAFLLNEEKSWVVSPAFDLTFAEGPGGQHQTSVAGYGTNITRKLLMKVAAAADIAPVKMRAIIEEVETVAANFYRIAMQLTDDIPNAELKRVTDVINNNLVCLGK
ncbi:type II toxin-antitoxin system HipA family toxin [Brenneria nigrifluens DSM 30175 = ATCC 13028]|uniref:Type II toxin-antitoxin system HipA family toxin n=2 Tax=Pectobacteriaceae TaxID=1903410 RepID=A0A2U1UX10_9GAMM|nr:HipA domain protein [Brenneria sp. EniD312]PWC26214.1 type II toxin-antitoxin system HipA family toxin [Brenneria nigrifluens DSM 30175 = ATCC 13028]QCR06971.1 type II toxin-antitoxin system HipA family toxin [Brenneria nigrifluens DSM 30175 = ATCC 13028]